MNQALGDLRTRVRMELSRNKIYAEGDILAVLEVDQKRGKKRYGCLMLNHAIGVYSNKWQHGDLG